MEDGISMKLNDWALSSQTFSAQLPHLHGAMKYQDSFVLLSGKNLLKSENKNRSVIFLET